MNRRRSLLSLWPARAAVALSLLLTLALAGTWVESYRAPRGWVRTRWELSATTDEWWTRRVRLEQGALTVAYTYESAPAFIGQVVGAGGAISPDRTMPSGTRWESGRAIGGAMVFGTGPSWLARLGISWELHDSRAAMLVMYPADRWGAHVRLWLPTCLAALATVGLALIARRAGRPFQRKRLGLCPRCGYDLRASPGRCPECGHL